MGLENRTPRRSKSGRAHTKVWVTKSGLKIRVCDMADSHLANTINYLQKVCARKFEETLKYYAIPPRGEMALIAYEQELECLLKKGVQYPAIYFDMVAELIQRGLGDLLEDE